MPGTCNHIFHFLNTHILRSYSHSCTPLLPLLWVPCLSDEHGPSQLPFMSFRSQLSHHLFKTAFLPLPCPPQQPGSGFPACSFQGTLCDLWHGIYHTVLCGCLLVSLTKWLIRWWRGAHEKHSICTCWMIDHRELLEGMIGWMGLRKQNWKGKFAVV